MTNGKELRNDTFEKEKKIILDSVEKAKREESPSYSTVVPLISLSTKIQVWLQMNGYRWGYPPGLKASFVRIRWDKPVNPITRWYNGMKFKSL